MRPTDIRLPGAVDLSALKARPAPGGAPGPAGGDYVFDVTEATFQTAVVDRSGQVPVILDFWAEWCGPCKQLSPVLERLAAEGNGRWALAKIDVDANQQLAAAFQVQSIPSVFAVIGGRGLPLFQGAVPEQQARAVIDEVLKVAAANGVTGPAGGPDTPPPAPPRDSAYETAQQALDRGDLDAATAAYRDILARSPADPLAKSALARCQLLARTRSVDEGAVRQRAEAAPDDVSAQAAMADVEMMTGRVDAAVDRLVGVVRRTSGDERDRARQHLLELFEVLSPDDPRLAAGRRALANALF